MTLTRDFLEQCLAEGLSLDRIAALADKHPSTISYHLKKHGLSAVNTELNAPKGGIAKGALEELVEEGLTLREIADRLGRGVTTVRYWLNRHGIDRRRGGWQRAQAHEARQAGLKRTLLECSHHGLTEFVLENRGYYRCARCRIERVSEWRRRAKRRLIAAAGGCCVLCGYDNCPAALQFHHLEPGEKEFTISREGVTRSFAELEEEAAKCVLLCANCHAEVESGYASVRN